MSRSYPPGFHLIWSHVIPIFYYPPSPWLAGISCMQTRGVILNEQVVFFPSLSWLETIAWTFFTLIFVRRGGSNRFPGILCTPFKLAWRTKLERIHRSKLLWSIQRYEISMHAPRNPDFSEFVASELLPLASGHASPWQGPNASCTYNDTVTLCL